MFSLFGFLGLNGNSVARQTEQCKQEDFLDFLKLIRKENPEGQLVIILDNAKIHKNTPKEIRFIYYIFRLIPPILTPLNFYGKMLSDRLLHLFLKYCLLIFLKQE